MKKVVNAVSKMYAKVVYNQKLLDTLTVLVLTVMVFSSFTSTVFAASGADPFSQIMDLICGLLQKIGGVVAFIGAFMIIWGIKDHNPDTKMNGVTTAAVGGGLFTLASVGHSFLN